MVLTAFEELAMLEFWVKKAIRDSKPKPSKLHLQGSFAFSLFVEKVEILSNTQKLNFR